MADTGPTVTRPQLEAARACLETTLAMMFREQADQVLFSALGIHLFKGSGLVLVGELGAPLPALLRVVREGAGLSLAATTGMLGVTAPQHPLEMLRVDIATGDGGAEAALLRHAAGTGTWPRPMLPRTYRLAA